MLLLASVHAANGTAHLLPIMPYHGPERRDRAWQPPQIAIGMKVRLARTPKANEARRCKSPYAALILTLLRPENKVPPREKTAYGRFRAWRSQITPVLASVSYSDIEGHTKVAIDQVVL